MRPILNLLAFAMSFFISTGAIAQGTLSISGTVTGEKGEVMKGATVFISGSQKITATNDEGKFSFTNLTPGSFQLSVTLLGYAAYSQNVIVNTTPVTVNIGLKVKPIILKEVVIGSGSDKWAERYRIFKAAFLGTSDNAQECDIINSQVLSFSTKKGTYNKLILTADADEFLIIYNKRLGYQIKYLLKNFEFNEFTGVTKYEGDTNFEEMDGTAAQKAEWAKNRLDAYNGSLMHFLRSVYADKVLKEGFLTHQLYLAKGKYIGKQLMADTRILKFDTIVSVIDTSFKALRFTSINVIYDPKRAAQADTLPADKKADTQYDVNNMGSILNLNLPEAVIDAKGSYTEFRAFLIQGYWGRRRIGDQLPFEYQPALITTDQ